MARIPGADLSGLPGDRMEGGDDGNDFSSAGTTHLSGSPAFSPAAEAEDMGGQLSDPLNPAPKLPDPLLSDASTARGLRLSVATG